MFIEKKKTNSKFVCLSFRRSKNQSNTEDEATDY